MPIEVKRATARPLGEPRSPSASDPSDADAAKAREAFRIPIADAEKVRKAFRGPDAFAREAVVQRATTGLLGLTARHKDVGGTGREAFGQGDFRVNERRAAVRALLANPSHANLEALAALGPEVQSDVAWLTESDFKDYVAEPLAGQFRWAENEYIKSEALDQSFEKRLAQGRTQAGELEAGKRDFLDVSDGSLIALHYLPTAELRSRSLVDALLQFRGRVDAANVPLKESTRLDREGPLSIAEQRILLAGAHFDPKDPQAQREYALLRLTLASHPISSVNGIYEARNAVSKIFMEGAKDRKDTQHATAWIKEEIPPGATHSPYVAIHHNFSRDTPRDISAFVEQWMLPVGPERERGPNFLRLVNALKLARGGSPAEARELATQVTQGPAAAAFKPLMDALKRAPDDQVREVLLDYLTKASPKNLGVDPEQNILLAAQMYRAVCQDEPTIGFLESNLFLSRDARPKLANVIAELRAGHQLGALVQLGEARLAMRDAVFGAQSGFARHQLLNLDTQLERLTSQELGMAVTRVGNLETDAQKSEALIALQTALRSAVASGLPALTSDADPAARKGRTVEQVLADVDAMVQNGSADAEAYRALMGQAYVAVKRTVQNIRALVDTRAPNVAAAGAELDPIFLDQLIKQSPLHYATALAQKGMAAGLKEEIEPRRIANIQGMRVLNGIGPVVFPKVVIAENAEALAKLGAPRDALTVLLHMDEKKLVMAGGLMVDTKDAPGGNSHLNLYAMNNGIPVLALPELRTRYTEFLKNAAREGGVYMDDSNGQLEMMTVAMAKERGLVTADSIKSLLPGNNRRITYLKTSPEGGAPDVLARHEAMVNENRATRNIELYVPQDEIAGKGRQSLSFSELAALGVAGRHLAGEKGLVLALLKSHPTLGAYVPDGSVVTTGRIRGLLAEAGLAEAWDQPWKHDPKVGVVNDANFLQSAFYTDAAYRAKVRQSLLDATHQKLTERLLTQDASGAEKLTAAGEALYRELSANPALAASRSWIARSSFTGEDRPGKSGAGQYESYPRLEDPVSRIKGIIGVVESAWHVEPVENNVAEEINLQHIMPAVVVQDCLDPTVSGVVISRDVENGARGRMTYQLVKGFGGGVEGGKTEEGLVSVAGHTVHVAYPDAPDGLVTGQQLQELRKIVLGVEQYFNEVVEKGKGHAVDMEVALVNGHWKIVQARVVLTDH